MPDTFDLPEPEIIAAKVNPEAAIAFWAWKTATPYSEVKNLSETARIRAFYVAGLEEAALVNKVYDGIGEALKNGETLKEFQARIGDVIDGEGWRESRVQTIFQSNLQTAYAAGRYAKMQDVKDARPYWQYRTVGDERVRPSHALLDGLIYPADHEFWDENHPPNGFNCRCAVRSLSARQVEQSGFDVEQEAPGDSMYTDPQTGMEYHVARPGADDGWRNNPGKTWLEDIRNFAAEKSENAFAVEKLEDAPGYCGGAVVRMFMGGDLEAWMKNPKGDFPLICLSIEDAKQIGGKSVIGRMSAETFAKQRKRHPELTLSDYMLAQVAVEKGKKIKQDERNLAFALDEPEGVVVIAKATRIGDKVYVTSVRRMSRKKAEREGVIRRLGEKKS